MAKKSDGISWKAVGYVVALIVVAFVIAGFMGKDVRYSSCEDGRQALQDAVDAAQTEVDVKQGEKDYLQTRLDDAQATLDTLNAQVSANTARIAEIDARLRTLAGYSAEVQATYADEVAALTTDRGTLADSNTQLARDIRNANIDVSGFTGQLADAQTALDTAQTALTAAQDALAAYECEEETGSASGSDGSALSLSEIQARYDAAYTALRETFRTWDDCMTDPERDPSSTCEAEHQAYTDAGTAYDAALAAARSAGLYP